MNYTSYTDEELVLLSRKNDDVMEFLLNKYKGMVLSSSKSLFILGGENEDLVQEGMIGLFKAVRDYDEKKNIKFSTFASVCIRRNIYTAITNSNNPKNDPLNKGVSISSTDSREEENDSEIPILSTDDLGLSDIYNPEANLIHKEKYEDLLRFMEKNLSEIEYKVIDLYIVGLSTSEIAKVLATNEKTTDNALQRAKNKIKKYVEGR